MSRTRKSIGFAAFAGMLLAASLSPLALSGLLDEQYVAYCLQASNAGDPVLGDPKCGAQVCAAFLRSGQMLPTDGICNGLNVHLSSNNLLARIIEHPQSSSAIDIHLHARVLDPSANDLNKWRNASWSIPAGDKPLPLELRIVSWSDAPLIEGADARIDAVHFHPAGCGSCSSTTLTGPFELYWGDPNLMDAVEPIAWPV